MEDQWTSRLSEYLDGELDASERLACETHLASCAECTATLEDLRRVVARARALSDAPPAADLWPGVESAVGRRMVVPFQKTPQFRIALTLPQLAAAGLVLAALSAGVAWLVLSRGGAARPEIAQGEAGTGVAVTRAGFAEESYDHAVADLERTLAERRAALDPMTVASIERTLQTIDRAIAEARQALERDPGNVYLNGHFAATRRRKLELLRQASALARTES